MRQLPALFAIVILAACAPTKPGDGGPDAGIPELPDADGDGIADDHEGRGADRDTDGDGTPDYLDEDSDDDGVPDYREAGDDHSGTPPVDSDLDGTPDFNDTDSDDNGRPDGIDGTADIDGDGVGDFADLDDDGDTITDLTELGIPENPRDSDSDGTPDFQDTDSDNDTILDGHEGAGDPDTDGKGAYVDNDSDGDCVPDAAEAGDATLSTPPIDTDDDNQKDFLDLDADNDGLLDQLEDSNCNGNADPGESSTTDMDTDNDGVTDLIEDAANTDPTNPADNPQANGDFVFLVPYQDAPMPNQDTLDFSTDITQADVVFTMDTTGSMGQEIGALKSSIGSLITQIRSEIPNTGFAVTGFEDFPYSGYGVAGDEPYYRHHRVMTTNTAAGLTSIQNAVNAYGLGNGNDGPESNWEALYQIATGAGVSGGNITVPAFNPATAYPTAPPAGEFVGTIGAAGVRTGSLPIVLLITDACGHNSGMGYGYSGIPTAATASGAVAALNGISARVIAVVSNPQTGGCESVNARSDMLQAVNGTNSLVPPAAWGPAGTRPASCAVGMCCTGIGGAGESPSGGMCPLLFMVDGNTGSGLGSAAATAVKVLSQYAEYDIGSLAVDDPSDAINAVSAFVSRVQAQPVGPGCANLPATDTNSDTYVDTFTNVNPGVTVCFDVIPKTNTTVPATTMPQMFKATVQVEGDGVTTLDTRDVWFLVPPEIPDVPIE
jgi:hypothetical protein